MSMTRSSAPVDDPLRTASVWKQWAFAVEVEVQSIWGHVGPTGHLAFGMAAVREAVESRPTLIDGKDGVVSTIRLSISLLSTVIAGHQPK